MENEILNIKKAFELMQYYKYTRQKSKQNFIKELIDYQLIFGYYSIVGPRLTISCKIRSTIDSVLKDLGLSLNTSTTII